MRRLPHIALASALAVTLSACLGGITSGLTVQPGEDFLLGGSQPEGFTVTGTNTGEITVEVLARRGTSDVAIGTVAGGEGFASDFGAGEVAVVRNTSGTQAATLQLRITGYTDNLRMANVPQE